LKTSIYLEDEKYLANLLKTNIKKFYLLPKSFNFGESFRLNSASKNFFSISDYNLRQIEKIAKKINKSKKETYILLNSTELNESNIDFIKNKYFVLFKKWQIKGLILSDFRLINSAKEFDFDVICSDLNFAINSDIIKYLIEIGVNKIQLPYEITYCELLKILEVNPDIDFEVLINPLFEQDFVFDLNLISKKQIPFKKRLLNYEFLNNYNFDKFNLINLNENIYRYEFNNIEYCNFCLNKLENHNNVTFNITNLFINKDYECINNFLNRSPLLLPKLNLNCSGLKCYLRYKIEE